MARPILKPVYLLYVVAILAGFFSAKALLSNIAGKEKLAQVELSPTQVKVPSSVVTVPEVAPALPKVPTEEKITVVKVQEVGVREKMQELPTPSFELSGTFLEQGFAYAIINNKVIKLGGKIEGARLVKVSDAAVELDFNGELIKLKINVLK